MEKIQLVNTNERIVLLRITGIRGGAIRIRKIRQRTNTGIVRRRRDSFWSLSEELSIALFLGAGIWSSEEFVRSRTGLTGDSTTTNTVFTISIWKLLYQFPLDSPIAPCRVTTYPKRKTKGRIGCLPSSDKQCLNHNSLFSLVSECL